MSLFSSITIITLFLLFLIYCYIKYQDKIFFEKKEKEEQARKYKLEQILIQKRKEEIERLKILEQERLELEIEEKRQKELFEQNILGKKEPVKYFLYNINASDYSLTRLYKDIIVKNLWINEPFHSKFYEFLMLISDNKFMIIDPYSKVITMNVRDKYNKVQTSKSYQVYSTKNIINHTITFSMNDIKRFNKKDAQNLIISTFVLVLKQSVHYLSKEVTQNIIDKMLNDYEQTKEIKKIIQMIEAKDEKVYFIQEFMSDAFSTIETLPYNDSEVKKSIEIRQELPKKFLQSI